MNAPGNRASIVSRVLGESIEIRQGALSEGHWLIFSTMSVLGERPVDA